jgi:hypothetical protein
MAAVGNSEKSESANKNWPSGISFLLYCAGISLVLLVGYVIFSGKGFDFSASDKGVAFKSALNQGAASHDPVEQTEKSIELKEKFERIARSVPPKKIPVDQVNAALDEDKVPEPVNVDSRIPTQTQPAKIAPVRQNAFNGSWAGNGSIYIFEQNGPTVALIEMTNGITTSFAQGTVNGTHASLMAANVSGLTFPIELEMTGNRIKITAMGSEFFLDPS